MKNIILLLIFCFSFFRIFGQTDVKTRDTKYWYQISVGKENGTATDSCAWLEVGVDNTTKGLKFPSTDTSNIIKPKKGLMIYQISDKSMYYYDGTLWRKLLVEYENTGGNTRDVLKIESFSGAINYTVTETPVSGTISATVNGKEEPIIYNGTGKIIIVQAPYTIASTDKIIIKYFYTVTN